MTRWSLTLIGSIKRLRYATPWKISHRHDRRRLDLKPRLVFDQRSDLHERHRRKVLAHDTAIGITEFAQMRQIFLLVEDEPGQPRDVRRFATRFRHERHDIGKRLARLADKIFAREALLG